MSDRVGRNRLLTCCFCKFQTYSKGGFAWHQTSAHGRSGGNGIIGRKRQRPWVQDEHQEEEEPGGVPARPRTRRHTQSLTSTGRSTADDGDSQPFAASSAGGEAATGIGALQVNDVGSYDDAIRAALYPLLKMTTAPRPDGEEGGVEERRTRGLERGATYEYQTLATQVRCLYEVLDDAARAVPVVERRKHARAGRFNNRRLRALQQFVLGVGGAGLSVREQRLLYQFLDVWDADDIDDVMSSHNNRSLRAVFPTVTSFTNSLRDDLHEAVLDAGWKKLRIQEGGKMHEAYFRPVLDVVTSHLRHCKDGVRLWSGENGPAPPTNARETPIDGDAFRLCEQEIVAAHGGSSFLMGIHMYSDSSQLSWSGGTLLLVCGLSLSDCQGRIVLNVLLWFVIADAHCPRCRVYGA